MSDQETNNAEKAPKLSCSETNQNALPQTYSVPTVELSYRREDQYDDTWPGSEHQNPGYYRHEHDQEHILELDPVTGKFVPQSDVLGRHKAMTDGSNEICRTDETKNEDPRKTRYGTFHIHMGQMMVLMYSPVCPTHSLDDHRVCPSTTNQDVWADDRHPNNKMETATSKEEMGHLCKERKIWHG
ncbi:hypothetical protein V8F06_012576 [Rhypophila decipiens]